MILISQKYSENVNIRFFSGVVLEGAHAIHTLWRSEGSLLELLLSLIFLVFEIGFLSVVLAVLELNL